MKKPKQPQPAQPVPAKPPPDDPLGRGMQDDAVSPDEARKAALARLKALEEAQRMAQRPDCQ